MKAPLTSTWKVEVPLKTPETACGVRFTSWRVPSVKEPPLLLVQDWSVTE